MRKDAYGLWRGDVQVPRDRFSLPCAHEIRGGGHEQDLKAEKYVSSYFSLSVQRIRLRCLRAVYLKHGDLRARGGTVKTSLHSYGLSHLFQKTHKRGTKT